MVKLESSFSHCLQVKILWHDFCQSLNIDRIDIYKHKIKYYYKYVKLNTKLKHDSK